MSVELRHHAKLRGETVAEIRLYQILTLEFCELFQGCGLGVRAGAMT